MYANKVNGRAVPGEHLTGNLDFITITVTAAEAPILALSDGGNTASQARLDKLVEIISLNGQPIIMGTPYLSSSNHVFKVAIEHTGAWTADTLEAAILAHQNSGMGFTGGNTAITISSSL